MFHPSTRPMIYYLTKRSLLRERNSTTLKVKITPYGLCCDSSQGCGFMKWIVGAQMVGVKGVRKKYG